MKHIILTIIITLFIGCGSNSPKDTAQPIKQDTINQDISNWNVSNVTKMNNLFRVAIKLFYI